MATRTGVITRKQNQNGDIQEDQQELIKEAERIRARQTEARKHVEEVHAAIQIGDTATNPKNLKITVMNPDGIRRGKRGRLFDFESSGVVEAGAIVSVVAKLQHGVLYIKVDALPPEPEMTGAFVPIGTVFSIHCTQFVGMNAEFTLYEEQLNKRRNRIRQILKDGYDEEGSIFEEDDEDDQNEEEGLLDPV